MQRITGGGQIAGSSNPIRDIRLKAGMRYHKAALLVVGIIMTSSMVYGVLSTDDMLGGSHPEKPAREEGSGVVVGEATHHPVLHGTWLNDGIQPRVWKLLAGNNFVFVCLFFPIRFILSGFVTLTTGELVLVCSGLAFWVAAGLQRVLGGPRFFQLVLLMCCLRLPVWTVVYIPLGSFMTMEAGLLGTGDLCVQPSATWLVAAVHTAGVWLVPPKIKFTLLNTLPLSENIFGWLLVAHLSLIRFPLSMLDVIVGVLVGTLAVSSFCYLSKFKVPGYLRWLDPGQPLIWHTQQDSARLAAAAQSFVNQQPAAAAAPTVAGVDGGIRNTRSRSPVVASHQPSPTRNVFATPSMPAPLAAEVESSTYELFNSLGYDREQTQQALTAANGNPDRALDSLLRQANNN